MPIGIRFLQRSSIEEYITHYLQREAIKREQPYIEQSFEDNILEMRKNHEGKVRDWFLNSTWSKIEITNLNGLKYLLALSAQWTKDIISINKPRILGYMAERAFEIDWWNFNSTSDKMKSRYTDFKKDIELFYQDSMLVLCSLDDNEKAELSGATDKPVHLYLHDGIGRGLPFLAVTSKKEEMFRPFMAYCVFKT